MALMLHSVLLAGSLVATPWLFAAGPEGSSHDGHATPVALPGWTQQLKGQTVVEDTIRITSYNVCYTKLLRIRNP